VPKRHDLCCFFREMECNEAETNKLDECIPVPVSFGDKLGRRFVAAIALFGPATVVFVSQYLLARHHSGQLAKETQQPPRHTIEAAMVTSEASPVITPPITVDVIATPPRSLTDQPAVLQLTTQPSGASFAVYTGIIADKAPPSSPPLRSGTSPATVEDLRAGNYTIFFHKEGWPDSRTEIELPAGQAVPVAYTFPHGELTITSDPAGAEILLGASSLGFTPLKVDLPSGEMELTARLKNFPDRKQSVSINENSTPTINFQMRTHRHTTAVRPAPTPSLIDKVGRSLKRLFGENSTPTPRRKR
jgi:PEGA domain